MTQRTLSKTIQIRDPWGAIHRAQVTWMPLPMTGLSAARDNFNMTEVAWATEDDCPVSWELDRSTSTARLRRNIRSYSGDIRMIADPHCVESTADLEPGAFVIRRY